VKTVGEDGGGEKLWGIAAEVWEQQFALNLRSGFVMACAAVPTMLKQGSGAIVNVASKAAVDHAPGASAYAASKAAAVAMIDSLAADLQGPGVRAISKLASIIDNIAIRKAMHNADFSNWPKPEEIARVILFLCCEDSKLIQGAAIPVYGDS
jgi:NAD(P)-dependent dehydrogenase (short-subunit alcohol dehydrogenase family)